MTLQGYIQDYDGSALTIVAPFADGYLLERRRITGCEIRLDDGRSISAEQRRKIYATLRDISMWSGHTPDELKAWMKYDFISKTGAAYFSLSNVDMATANEFLEHLIEFCIENDIPCEGNPIERSPDIARALYACLVYKRCCICGGKAELHHAEDRVQAGRNRKEIVHLGMRVEPLCRKHHGECHNLGQQTFHERHHIFGIKLDKELCKIWKVKG